MSSPADQLASVKATPTNQLATAQDNLAQQQSTATFSGQSDIASQAAADANSLNSAAVDDFGNADTGQQLAAQKNIAATKSSIFSTADGAVVLQPTNQLPVAVNALQGDQGASQTLNASQNSIYAGGVPVVARDMAAIPLPNASAVAEVQDLALAGMPIPAEMQVASADVFAPIGQGNPVVTNAAIDQTPQTANRTDEAAVQASGVQPTEKVVKKSRTLADFFRKKTETASFDNDRFGQKRTREINTAAIPNMRTAALADDSLPGVNTNAMLSVGNIANDEGHEDDDDAPGLMKLASLSGMTRVAPNGIWTQTDQVEVRCLRPQLVSMLQQVEKHYRRPVVVTSGFRDVGHNRRAGGVRHSLHTLCAAADIQIEGVSKWELADYLRSIPGRGGVGTYCHTDSVHIDIGGERDWNWRCRRKKFRRG
ncbi:YcbK family protein [Rhizobium sp. KVB221]|uniref:YcbK family protein n=1 Tax=Rhizobium setariae TaxID=2801340 RepID=A0A937CPL5_9HYPH|nr:YcbK family protein [Rhizobium setariae]MBL0375051.1 YcbK family protein [Rhizobium setariae]